MNKKIGLFLILSLLPATIFAAGSVEGILDKLLNWIDTLGKIIMAATVVAFFWGLFQFVFNEDKRKEGKSIMIWGVVALFVMVSIWGLVKFIGNTFNIDQEKSITLPSITNR